MQSYIRPDFEAQIRNHIIPAPLKLDYLGDEFVEISNFRLLPEENTPAALFADSFAFGGMDTAREFLLKWNSSLEHEAYSLKVTTPEILLEASSAEGFFYASRTIEQMRVGNFLPAVEIYDAPAMKLRGFHTNLGTIMQLSFEDTANIFRKLGKFKLNTYLLEYTDRFPHKNHPLIPAPNAFTPDNIKELDRLAEENKIEIIPLVQCLGHTRHIGRHAAYSHLFEKGDEKVSTDQFCPLNEDAFNLFVELADEIMKVHPRGKYLHIGGDETRFLGICPKCREVVNKYGKSRLYVDYLNKVCAWVRSRGRIPIIWDDMLSRHPESLQNLDEHAIIMYWDYWTTMFEKSPIMVARMCGHGIVNDVSVDKNICAGYEEPEKTILRYFSKSVDVMEILSRENGRTLRRYLGNDLPHTFNGFPYLDYYKEHGREVISAPTTLGNCIDDIYGLPNYGRFRANIRAFAEKTKRAGTRGMITSSWYNFPAEMLDIGIIDTAQNCWCPHSEMKK